MKKHNLIIISILIVLLAGCGGSVGETELDHPDKSPESLDDVSTGIDDIGNSLDKIERIMMNIPLLEDEKEEDQISQIPDEGSQEESSKEGNQNNQEESSGEAEQGGSGSEGNTGGNSLEDSQQSEEPKESKEPKKSEEEIKNEKIEKSWQEVEKKIEEVHSSWNDYQIEAQEKGVTKDELDSFEKALNKMTMAVVERNMTETYHEISQTYLTLKPIFDYYKDDIMAELTNLKYDTYRSYRMGIDNSQEGNFQILEDNEDLYNKIRQKLDDDDDKDDLINRLEYSATSLRKGLKENSRRVNMIKKNVVLDNIKELQK